MRTSSFLCLLAACLLSACATTPAVVEHPDPFLAGELFGPPTERISTADVLTVTDAMRRYIAVDIADQLRTEGKQTGLIDALYQKGQLKLEYDATTTKTAAESFASRSGNCLSLVIMTAAFAHELNLPIYYQSAYLEETWSRTGSLLFANGHVNVSVGRRIMDAGTSYDLSPLTIDFLPPEDIRSMRTRTIDESTVLAMFANNRAAEALTRGELDNAYAWTVEALRRDPSFMGAWNTLGVVYLQHHNAYEAVRVFERVLERDPNSTRALANIAEGYDLQGRGAEATAMRTRLAALEPYPPFHFFNLGVDAMRIGNYLAAREYFTREVDRADYYHEFHFWLGLADWNLGDVAQAKKHLQLALDNSTTRSQHDLYAAKLEWLQAHRQQ